MLRRRLPPSPAWETRVTISAIAIIALLVLGVIFLIATFLRIHMGTLAVAAAFAGFGSGEPVAWEGR